MRQKGEIDTIEPCHDAFGFRLLHPRIVPNCSELLETCKILGPRDATRPPRPSRDLGSLIQTMQEVVAGMVAGGRPTLNIEREHESS